MVTSRLTRIAAVLLIGTGAALAQTATQPNTQTRPATGQQAPAPAPQAPRTTPAPAPAAPAATAPRPAAPAATAPAAQGQLVNLNTATAAELDALPQIGEARAKAIIEARTKGGRFKNWEDFVARNVVPKNAEDAIKGKVRF